MTMHQQQSGSKARPQAIAGRRPNNLLTTATIGATSISGGGGVRTPPTNRVVLMKRVAANASEELQDAAGGGDADSYHSNVQQGKRYADRTTGSRQNRLINFHAEDEFPPLMSPASSAVSSPQKTDKYADRRQQNQSEIVRAGGRGILNMLKRDGLLNDAVTLNTDEYAKPHRFNYPPSSSLGRENRNADEKGRTNSSNYEKKQYFDNTEQILNNSSNDSACYTTVSNKQSDNNYYQTYYAAGDFDGYAGPQRSANISRKSSVGTAGRKFSAVDPPEDEDDSALHDLDEAERITEKMSTAQARIKQQINARLEFEKQQQRQQQLNGTVSTERKPTMSSTSSNKTDSAVVKPLPAAANMSGSVAGVIKLVRPADNAVQPQRDVVKTRSANPPVRRIAASALHGLADHTLKDKYLPKPQCLINHNMDWQETTQKLLLREYLDEQNELFTVIAVCGPQSSGKSTILSCLGIQSMGNFHLFDHDAELVSPARRQTASINVYINAKQRVILLDSPGMLSTQLLAELMNRPTRPPPLFNGDKLNNIGGVHVYLEHQAEVYAYQLAAFLFAVSHVVLFCSDHMPADYYQWVVEFLHKTCIMKPPVLSIDLQNPLCGVVNVDEMMAQQRQELRAKRLAEKAERNSYSRSTRGGGVGRLADSSRAARSAVKESIADHWPNLYFIVNKASDATAELNNNGGLQLCTVPDDRARLEKALKSLVGSTPLGRATRFTDKLRISSTTTAVGARSDEEKWPKLAYEDCQLFVVPFVGHQQNSSNAPALQPSKVDGGNVYASTKTSQSVDFAVENGEEEHNPALRFIFDDNLTLSYKTSGKTVTKKPVAREQPVPKQRAGILTGVKLTPYGNSYDQYQHRILGARNSNTPVRFRNIRSQQKWQPANYSGHASFYRRPRAGLISRAPSSHVCRHAHYRGGGVEQAFYTDLGNVEKFIVEKHPKKSISAHDDAAKKSETGTVTWKDVLANKQAYDTIARLRRTCFNAPALPITPGVRMSEKQWLRYASAMWSHIKSDSAILNYARAINMASSSTAAAGT